jgi:hypothetical protein
MTTQFDLKATRSLKIYRRTDKSGYLEMQVREAKEILSLMLL